MKRVLQNYRTGELIVEESPLPQLRPGWLLVKTSHSLISAGTEKTKVDAGSKSLMGKARSRPDLVKQVLARAKKDGLWKTWEMVSDRLDTPVPMGYSSAGAILDVQGDVGGLSVGELVACAGSTANHAEVVVVPRNLVVPVPEGVASEEAAFATIGAIAMQGVRQAEVRLGERVAVIGLGLIGLLTVQIARAAGARVFGIDIDPRRLEIAKDLGCEAAALGTDEGLEEAALLFTGGYGFDATIITAASASNIPVEQAAILTREKGRVVVVGLTKMDVPREPFYMKELDLRLSRSYGPGRYDRSYEEEGHDYPYAYVRFTEQRNMACFLDLVAAKQVRLGPITTHRFPIEAAGKAYDLIRGQAKEPYLGILLEYPRALSEIPVHVELKASPIRSGQIRVGVIGAGKYASSFLLPHLQKDSRVALGMACTSSGVTATHVARKFGFHSVTSDGDAVIADSQAVVVATRHNDHADYVVRAVKAGKPVFVEKPMVITSEQVEAVIEAVRTSNSASVMVGFNRRFAPATLLVLEHFKSIKAPRQVTIRVNAGAIAKDHWVHDPLVGGGRLIGEGCHFLDLAVCLTGSRIQSVSASAIPKAGVAAAIWDDFSVVLGMEDGSVATVAYTSIGDTRLPKERIEVSGGGRSAVIDDFGSVELYGGGKKVVRRCGGDKGQSREMQLWIEGLANGTSPIPFDELVNVHRACLAAIRSIEQREAIRL